MKYCHNYCHLMVLSAGVCLITYYFDNHLFLHVELQAETNNIQHFFKFDPMKLSHGWMYGFPIIFLTFFLARGQVGVESKHFHLNT